MKEIIYFLFIVHNLIRIIFLQIRIDYYLAEDFSNMYTENKISI